MAEATAINSEGAIVAKASWDYRWRRFALVVVIFGYGLYSAYDGFIHYPEVNRQALIDHPGIEQLPYPGLDIPFNQKFGIILPPLSLVFLCWVLYASRGHYRYDGTNLSVPGHASVPVTSIRKIDRSKWDRKGIAYLHYQLGGGNKPGVIKLDDFVYERRPTDAIFEQVEKTFEATNAPVPADTPADAPIAEPTGG